MLISKKIKNSHTFTKVRVLCIGTDYWWYRVFSIVAGLVLVSGMKCIYVNRRWVIGISVCHEFFLFEKQFLYI